MDPRRELARFVQHLAFLFEPANFVLVGEVHQRGNIDHLVPLNLVVRRQGSLVGSYFIFQLQLFSLVTIERFLSAV